MKNYDRQPDLTVKQPADGGGMDLRLLFMCTHKGARAGGGFRGNLPMRCPACNAKGTTNAG